MLCDPGSELRLGGREKGEDNKWDGKKRKEKEKKSTVGDKNVEGCYFRGRGQNAEVLSPFSPEPKHFAGTVPIMIV